MKTRWTSESIRIRITPAELQALLRNEVVRQQLKIGAGTWSAAIVPGCACTDYSLTDGALQVNLSAADRGKLADPNAEGVYFEPSDVMSVRFYIEKDQACEHPRAAEAGELETETFEPAKQTSKAQVPSSKKI
jgi:hypothetical protein